MCRPGENWYSMKKILTTIFIVCLVGALYPLAMRYSQSFKFVDEDEHMVIGWLVANGRTLYTDISTNHQPLNYLFSAVVHQLSHPANVFMLVQRHRQVVFFWGVVWAGILAWRFGAISLIPVLLFESTKYWLLGNLFLAESFAVYPTAYLFCAAWQQLVHGIVRREEWFLGICFITASFFSIPLAIPLGFLLCIQLIVRHSILSWIETAGGALVVAAGVFTIVPIKDYWMETIYYNSKYGIPLLSEFKNVFDVINLWIIPFRSFFPPYDVLSILFAGIGCVWFCGVSVHIIRRRWSQVLLVILFYFLWGLTNLRVIELHQFYYSGFHLLPWYLTGLILTTMLAKDLIQISHGWMRRALLLWLGLGLGWIALQPTLPIRRLPNPQTENYIQYTPQQQVAEVINSLKNPNDRLMTIPNETLPYWITGLLPATRQVTYYEWQYRNPLLEQQWFKTLSETPPRFITYFNEGASFTPHIQYRIQTSYVKLFDYPLVYMRKDSLNQVSLIQQQQFLDLAKTHSGINIGVFNTK